MRRRTRAEEELENENDVSDVVRVEDQPEKEEMALRLARSVWRRNKRPEEMKGGRCDVCGVEQNEKARPGGRI